jgi:hypothetical protein
MQHTTTLNCSTVLQASSAHPCNPPTAAVGTNDSLLLLFQLSLTKIGNRSPGVAALIRRRTPMLRSSAWASVTPLSRCLSTLQMQWQRQLLAWPPVRDTAGGAAKGASTDNAAAHFGQLDRTMRGCAAAALVGQLL